MIFDVIMPKKGGKEVYDEIRKIRSDIRVLFASGYAEDRIDRNSLLQENANFIQKPTSPKALLRKVREVLDK